MRSSLGLLSAAALLLCTAQPSAAQMSMQGTGGVCYICSSCTYEPDDCEPGQNCTEFRHILGDGPAPSGFMLPHWQCAGSGWCSNIHPTCPGGQARLDPAEKSDLNSLLQLVALGDTEAIVTVLDRYTDIVSVRAKDHTLLVAGDCANTAHLVTRMVELSPEQMARIAEVRVALAS